MWIAEFRVWHMQSPLLPISARYDIHAFSQYLNTYREKGKSRILRRLVIWGRDKEKAIEEVRKSPRSEILYRDGDQLFFAQDAVVSFHTLVSDKTVFFASPILEENGYQYWRVGSNRKNHLLHFYRKVKKQKDYASIELMGIKSQNADKISFSCVPHISEKDLEWIKIARIAGYYEYPRRISLVQLSRKMGVPFSTLKDHLRKTENTLISQFARER